LLPTTLSINYQLPVLSHLHPLPLLTLAAADGAAAAPSIQVQHTTLVSQGKNIGNIVASTSTSTWRKICSTQVPLTAHGLRQRNHRNHCIHHHSHRSRHNK